VAAKAARLEAVWAHAGRDWSQDKSLAALWAYHRRVIGAAGTRPKQHALKLTLQRPTIPGRFHDQPIQTLFEVLRHTKAHTVPIDETPCCVPITASRHDAASISLINASTSSMKSRSMVRSTATVVSDSSEFV
jgi:hypothetical protein